MNEVIRLYPAAKDYLWGGTRLCEKFGKTCASLPCAETWELSFHPDGPTRTADGRLLRDLLSAREIGFFAASFPSFPVLIKFIDAKQNLSVQVHPSDEYALAHENEYGKTEMWHIVEADEGAGIYLGFSRDVSREEFEAAIAAHTLTELLNFIPVHAGETYFIPSGTVHAIGAGCLIYEVQQNSNLTYRVYDYGRRGKDGKQRELHVEKALAVADLRRYTPVSFGQRSFEGELIGQCRYFSVRRLKMSGRHVFRADEASFRCLSVLRGQATVGGASASAGDSFFVPAGTIYSLFGEAELLVTSVERILM